MRKSRSAISSGLRSEERLSLCSAGMNGDEAVGYTLIEVGSLNGLAVRPDHQDLAVWILEWIAAETNAAGILGKGVVEVIWANYHGEYPVLGARGPVPDTVEADVRAFAEDLLSRVSLGCFAAFAAGRDLPAALRSPA